MEEVKAELPFVTVDPAADSEEQSSSIVQSSKKFSSLHQGEEMWEFSEYKKKLTTRQDNLTHYRIVYSPSIYEALLFFYWEKVLLTKTPDILQQYSLRSRESFSLTDPSHPDYKTMEEAQKILEMVLAQAIENKGSGLVLFYKFFYLQSSFSEGLVQKLLIQVREALSRKLPRFFQQSKLLSLEALQQINLATCFQETLEENLGVLYIKDVIEKLLMIRVNFFNSRYSMMMEKSESPFLKDALSLESAEIHLIYTFNKQIYLLYGGEDLDSIRRFELLDAELISILHLESWPLTDRVKRLPCLHGQHIADYQQKEPCGLCSLKPTTSKEETKIKESPKKKIAQPSSKPNVANRSRQMIEDSREEVKSGQVEKKGKERYSGLISKFRTKSKEKSQKDKRDINYGINPENMLDTDSDLSESSIDTEAQKPKKKKSHAKEASPREEKKQPKEPIIEKAKTQYVEKEPVKKRLIAPKTSSEENARNKVVKKKAEPEINSRYQPKVSFKSESAHTSQIASDKGSSQMMPCGHSIGDDARDILKALKVKEDVCFQCDGPVTFSSLVKASAKLNKIQTSHQVLKSQAREKQSIKKCIFCDIKEDLQKLPLCEHQCCSKCEKKQGKSNSRLAKRTRKGFTALTCKCNKLIPLSFLKNTDMAVTKNEVKSVCCPGFSALVGESGYEESKGVRANVLICYNCGIERCLICFKKLDACKSAIDPQFSEENLGTYYSKKFYHLQISTEEGYLECSKCQRILSQCICSLRKFSKLKCHQCGGERVKVKAWKHSDKEFLKCEHCKKRTCTICEGECLREHKCK